MITSPLPHPPWQVAHGLKSRAGSGGSWFGPSPPRQDLDRVTLPRSPWTRWPSGLLWTEGQTYLKTLPSLFTWSIIQCVGPINYESPCWTAHIFHLLFYYAVDWRVLTFHLMGAETYVCTSFLCGFPSADSREEHSGLMSAPNACDGTKVSQRGLVNSYNFQQWRRLKTESLMAWNASRI